MTTGKPTAILLSPTPEMVRAVRQVGARSLVLSADLSDPAVREAALSADEALPVQWCDHPRLLDAISHFADPPLRNPAPSQRASVFGFGEAGALVAARANEALGLPGNPHAGVAYLTDKAALRDRVNQLAVSPVRFERIDRAASLVPAAERVGFPCVVKPRTGSAGQDVHKLHSAAEADALARRLAPEPALIVEEFLSGPEYSVQAHSRNGKHQMLAVTRTHTTGAPECLETGYDLPAGLGRRSVAAIHDLVKTTLNAAGHRFGPSHTEVVLTERGPALIESHAHPGSDRIGQLLALATGVDLYALTFATVLGLPEPSVVGAEKGPGRYASARCLPLSLTELHDAERAAAARAVKGVVSVELGASLGRHAPATTSRVAGHGVITAAAASPRELALALRTAEDRLLPARASAREEELSAV